MNCWTKKECVRIEEDKISKNIAKIKKTIKKRCGCWIAHRRVLSQDSPTATQTRLYSSFLIRKLNDEERTLNVRQKKNEKTSC